ncbi:MAG: DUF4271 domain-containing protein [Bacteroidales bacterium]|nr:DUF4271 domain-containing protein [Bacteroidales bacterium]
MVSTDTIPYQAAFGFQPTNGISGDSALLLSQDCAPSLFYTDYQLYEPSLQKRHQSEMFQPFWFLILSLVFIIILTNVFRGTTKSLFLGFFVKRVSSGVNEQDRAEKSQILPRLINFFFLLNLSIFLNTYFFLFHEPIRGFLFNEPLFNLFIFLFALWLVRFVFFLITHLVFLNWKSAVQLTAESYQTELVFTAVLIPSNFLFHYALPNPLFAQVVLSILAVVFFLNIISQFKTLWEKSALRGYQIFLYLCTLEILPLLVVFKYFAG